tara:strand:+ start:196 stop:717 length:522 start_codon:yes stop_codon:yes gene_type:complete
VVDRRRLRAGDSYTPNGRGPAIAKQRAAQYRFNAKRQPFRTEQSPGTGGFGSGLETQIMRNQQASYDKARSESYRPETFKYNDPKANNIESQRREIRENMTTNDENEYFKVGNNMSRGGNTLQKETSNLSDANYRPIVNEDGSKERDMVYSDGSDDHEYKYETDAKGKRRYPS